MGHVGLFGLVTGGVESQKVCSTSKPEPSWFLSHDRCVADCVPHKIEEASSKKRIGLPLPYSEHPPSAPRARLSDLALRITTVGGVSDGYIVVLFSPLEQIAMAGEGF